MTLKLNYPDVATFVDTVPDGYGNNKDAISQIDVPVIFIQATGFVRAGYQEAIDADAICFPDFTNDFIEDNHNRLEGMYIREPLFGGSAAESWYKVTQCTVNRDHLLGNTIDNIELRLKKTRPIAGVS